MDSLGTLYYFLNETLQQRINGRDQIWDNFKNYNKKQTSDNTMIRRIPFHKILYGIVNVRGITAEIKLIQHISHNQFSI